MIVAVVLFLTGMSFIVVYVIIQSAYHSKVKFIAATSSCEVNSVSVDLATKTPECQASSIVKRCPYFYTIDNAAIEDQGGYTAIRYKTNKIARIDFSPITDPERDVSEYKKAMILEVERLNELIRANNTVDYIFETGNLAYDGDTDDIRIYGPITVISGSYNASFDASTSLVIKIENGGQNPLNFTDLLFAAAADIFGVL